MNEIKNEQHTATQVYRELSEADKAIFKAIVDLALVLWKSKQ